MALNPFFLQGAQSEQRLIQELINEQLKMYGVDVTYLPRKVVNRDSIFREIQASKFDDSYTLEAYVNTYEGYSGQGDIMTKFGLSIKDELTLTISRERFEDFISPFLESETDSEIIIANRPREGDLIYFPLGQRLFEVKFVEHEDPFYQLGKNYVFLLKCELFEYEDEVIDTSIDAIDSQVEEEGFITTLKLIGLGKTATSSAVINTNYVREFFLNNDGTGFTSPPTITFEPSPVAGGTATAVGILTTLGGTTSLKEVLITNAGYGYTIAPTVQITGGGGTGAAATCSIETSGTKGVIAFTITDGGIGYSAPPLVTIANPTAGAAATATVDAIGGNVGVGTSAHTVTELTLSTGGVSYITAPEITIAGPTQRSGVLADEGIDWMITGGTGYTDGGIYEANYYSNWSSGIGTGARFKVTASGGTVTGITTVYGGMGYETNKYLYLMGGGNNAVFYTDIVTTGIGSTATATASITAGVVTAINITNPGFGYTFMPVVTIDNSAGVKTTTDAIANATGTSIINTANQVTAIRITNTGEGYTTNPVVTIADPPLIVGVGTYLFNEEIVVSTSGAKALVKSWDATTNTLKITVTNSKDFTDGELVVGSTSDATYAADVYTETDIYDNYNSGDEIETEADQILDFTQSNPFGLY